MRRLRQYAGKTVLRLFKTHVWTRFTTPIASLVDKTDYVQHGLEVTAGTWETCVIGLMQILDVHNERDIDSGGKEIEILTIECSRRSCLRSRRKILLSIYSIFITSYPSWTLPLMCVIVIGLSIQHKSGNSEGDISGSTTTINSCIWHVSEARGMMLLNT